MSFSMNAIRFQLLPIFDRSILSVFRGYQFLRVDTRHVLLDRISSYGRVSSRCTLAIWARSTREKFIYLRFRRWPRERFIHRVNRERGRTSETFLPSKQGISRSHVSSLFTPNQTSVSRSISVFLLHVRAHRASRHGVLQDVFYFDPVRGGRHFLRECTIHGNNT